MLDRALTGGPALDSTLETAIVRVAAGHGDEALREELLDGGPAIDLARGSLPVSECDGKIPRSGADRSRPRAGADAGHPEPGHGDLPRRLPAQSRRASARLVVREAALDRARTQGDDLRRRYEPDQVARTASATRRRATTSRRFSARTRCPPRRGRSFKRSSGSTTASRSRSSRPGRLQPGWRIIEVIRFLGAWVRRCLGAWVRKVPRCSGTQ